MPNEPNQRQDSDLGETVHKFLLAEFSPPHAVVDEESQITYLPAHMGAFLQPTEGPPDTSERKKLEQALRESEGQLRDFVENATIGLHWVGPDGTILWANQAELDMLGYSAAEYIGRSIAEFHVDRPVIEEILSRLRNREELRNCEARLRHRDGSIRHVVVNSKVYCKDGEPVHTRCFTRDVTGQKVAEEALLETTGRLMAIINTAVDGIIAIGSQGVIETVNPAAVKLFGYTSEELVGQNVKMLMPERFPGEHHEYLANYPRTGERIIIGVGRELLGRRKDGSTFPIELAVSKTKLGNRSLFTGIVRDVSERKRAEKDLASLAAIVNSSDDAIISKNLQGIIQTWNSGAQRLFGYTAEEAVGQPITMLIPPERHTEEADILSRLARGERIEHYETVRVTKDRRLVNVSLTVSPVRDASGEIVAASKIARDITERKRHEEALAARAEQQAAVAEFGTRALAEPELQVVFDRALHVVTATLGVDYCMVLELAADGGEFLLRAGAGWQEGLVGAARVSAGVETQAGYTLISDEPVVVDDLRTERRFDGPPLLRDHGVVSGVSTIIQGAQGRPWGVLGAHSRSPRKFTPEDVAFLSAIANVLSGATQRAAADQALRRSERLYRGIGESIDYGVWVCDRTGRNLYASKSFLDLIGLTQEQCSEFGWANVLHPGDAQATLEAWRQTTKDGEFWEREHRFKGADGGWHYVLARGVPVRDEQGNIEYWAGINLDISESKRAEAALRKSEEQFRTLANTIPQLAWTARPDGWIYWYNQRWYEYTGTTREQMAGWGWQDVHNPEALPRIIEHWKSCLASGEPWEDTFQLRGNDGQYRWFLSQALPIRDDAGRIVQWFGTNTDISGQREMEEALRESEEQFRRAVEEAPIPVIMHAEDGEVLQISHSWTELTGYSLEETRVVPNWLARAYGHGGEDVRLAVEGLFDTPGTLRAVEFDVVTRSGEQRVWSISASSPGVLRDGRRFIVSMAEDITDRKLAEDLVRRSEQRYRSLAHATNDIVWTTNAVGEFLEPQPEWEVYTGQRWPEHQGMGWLAMFHPEDRERLREWWTRTFDSKHVFESENRLWHAPSGKWHSVVARAAAVRGPDGSVVEWIGTITDVDELKLAEEGLRQSEERYRKIFQSAYVSIWQEDFSAVKDYIDRLRDEGITDFRSHFENSPDDVEEAISLVRVRDVNEATLAMFEALDPSELVTSLHRIFLPGARRAFIDQLVAVAEGRPLLHAETRVQTLRGRPIDIVFTVSFPSTTADWSSVLVSIMDVTERREAEQALRESEERLRIAVHNAPLVLYHCDTDLRYSWFANEPHPDFPIEQLLGRTPVEVLGEAAEPLMEAMSRVLDTGLGQRTEFSHETSLGRQTWDIALEPLRDFTGKIIGVTGAALEITERKQAEERQRLLLAELSHRVKNTLATVQSVATQTAMHAGSVQEFRKAFEARLHSLAQTHSLLTRGRWRGAELRAIVLGEMGAHGGVEAGRTTLTGPTIYLTPKAALSLHLVLHELATNAAKYGALSNDAGQVRIQWSIDENDGGAALQLMWVESDGPRVVPPSRHGFGTTVIENSVGYELDGQTKIKYLETGLQCEIQIPWSDEVGFATKLRAGKD